MLEGNRWLYWIFSARTISAKIITHMIELQEKPKLPLPSTSKSFFIQCSNLPFLLTVVRPLIGLNTGLEHGLLPRFIEAQYGVGLGGWNSLERVEFFCGPWFRAVFLENEGGKSCPRSWSWQNNGANCGGEEGTGECNLDSTGEAGGDVGVGESGGEDVGPKWKVSPLTSKSRDSVRTWCGGFFGLALLAGFNLWRANGIELKCAESAADVSL